MSRDEFLDKLKHALGNDLNSAKVQEHVNYYASYIDGEMAKGRSESEVIDELGDPWAISRNIVGMQHVDEIDPGRKARADQNRQKKPEGSKTHVFTFDTRGKRIALVVGIVLAIFLVMSIVSGIISFLAPVLFPILLVVWVVRMVRRRRG